MGEHGGETPLAPAPPTLSRRLASNGALLALALVLLALLALALASRALDREEADALLLARSLAGEGDRLWQVADRARAEGLTAAGQLPAEETTAGREYGETFETPLVYGLALAPWAALGGARGALLAQWALLALAALCAARKLARQVGRDAAWLPALLLVASAAGAYVLRLWPEALLAAALLAAFTLARGEAPPVVEGIPDLYPEAAPARPALFAPRWLAVGALLGAVASAAPWTLPLLWPAGAAVPAGQRRRGVALLLLASLVVLLLLAVAGAATAGAPPSPRALLDGLGVAHHGLPRAEATTLDAKALGWDVAYLFAGRHLGLLLYFAPLVLFAFLGGRGEGRGALWGAAALSLLLLVLMRPFDLAGTELTIALRPLVPLAAALCLSPARSPGRIALLFTLAWSAVWLWPLWRS
ncbi:MAG TPA: hypothetical protein VGV61_10785, partial [Thermoanaerobaculia bacterium]|nr:hypothetical protein [Thermoanaerobaculia bacterium]